MKLPIEVANPLDKVSGPDFTVFGAEFTSWWVTLLAGVWAIGMVVAIGFLIHGLVMMGVSKGERHPGHLRESKKEAATAGMALGGLAALPVIVGAIIAVAS